MTQLRDAPDIARALESGYNIPGEYYETEQIYYVTDEGEMSPEEVAAYMTDYIKTNLDDAAELFGIKRRTRTVLCDAYGEPYE